MNRIFRIIVLAAFIVSLTAPFSLAACSLPAAHVSDEKESLVDKIPANSTCPVMEGKVDKDTPYKAAYGGKTIGFCCAGCVDAFKADPSKYEDVLKTDTEKRSECNKEGRQKCVLQ